MEQLNWEVEDVFEGNDREMFMSAVGNLRKCCKLYLREGWDDIQQLLRVKI